MFAAPSNLLVLDEPTNDLDLESLDLLEEVLASYDGTVLLVSHDRDFLDRLVASIIVMPGDGSAIEHAGGYSDLPPALHPKLQPAPAKRPARQAKPAAVREAKGRRMSYNEQRELERLPAAIERLSAQAVALEADLADPGFYRRDRQAYEDAAARLGNTKRDLAAAEERWLELEARREADERKEPAPARQSDP